MTARRIAKTVIIGTGLIGGSFAAAGRRRGLLDRVVGVGRRRANLETARAAGLIDEISHDPAAAVEGADLIVLAAPVDSCLDLLGEIAPALGESTIVTDVGSVKAPLCRRARELGVARRFVGAHPMAGGVSSGAALADADLFVDCVVVLTPTPENAAAAVSTVADLWRALGARVLEIEPERHDAVVAVSSHLPQMVASCLSATAGEDPCAAQVAELAGAGFRDTTRIAASDTAMWLAIANLNRPAIVAAMEAFSQHWRDLTRAVREADGEAIAELFERGRAFKKKTDG